MESGLANTFQLSLAHLTTLELSPPDLTYTAQRTGYDYVSFRVIHLGLASEPNYEMARNPALLQETRAALAATGMQVLDIELARIKDGVDVKSYLPALETGAELKTHNLICSVWTRDEVYAKEAVIELCEMAKDHDLTVNLEFVTWSNLADLKCARRLIEQVQQPNLALLLDILHFHRSRVSLDELDTIPAEWFRFVHLCDAPKDIPGSREELVRTGREERLDPGEGEIDIAAILNRIPRTPYSIEVPNHPRVKRLGHEEHARLACKHARSYLATNLGWQTNQFEISPTC